MKLLSPRIHGYIDYLFVPVLLLAPSVLGFGGIAAGLCYGLALFHLLMSLLTAYPLGVAKIIPFTPVHAGIEVVAAIGLIIAPWLFGFSADRPARWFFLLAGAALGIVWVITDYQRATIEERRPIGATDLGAPPRPVT